MINDCVLEYKERYNDTNEPYIHERIRKYEDIHNVIDYNDDKVSLIVSHGGRMRWLLGIRENIKFNHGAVLRMYVSDKECYATMIFSGFNPSAKYFGINKNCILFGKMKLAYRSKTPKIFYIIRHTEGYHNFLSFTRIMQMEMDAKLTIDGIIQARLVGKILQNLNININCCFVSDLNRTQNTMALILKEMNKNKPIYVLPCAHENNIGGVENLTKCTPSKCRKVRGFTLNWSLYMNRNKCDINMIEFLTK